MIVTFYSYKGGVGRSMALAHVAEALAERGLRVLAVDFDLEAPGLEWYLHGEDGGRERRRWPGLADLLAKYREAFASEAAFERAEYRRLRTFIQPALQNVAPPRGALDLMTAGCREPADKLRDYALAVRNFDWQDFFFNWKGELFFEWLRRRWIAGSDGEAGYDLVLVDSRTGVTEMGGICAYQLADAVVMFCAPNYQNLEGTRDVARDFASPSVRALRRDRPLQTLAVPARLVAHHPQRARFLRDFERELGREGMPPALREAGLDFEALALHYAPELAIGEGSIGRRGSGKRGDFDRAIARLADALLLMADPEGPLQAERDAALERVRGKHVATTPLQADTRKASAGWDAYIDCGEADMPEAQRLALRLNARGLRVLLPAPGTASQSQAAMLEQALAYSANLLLCFGHTSGSPSRDPVLLHARRYPDLRLIPVLLSGARKEAVQAQGLDHLKAFDARDGNLAAQHVEALVQVLRRSVAPTASPDLPGRPPFPGARPFDAADREGLSGRDAQVDMLVRLVRDNARVELVGPAQVGKTSLVQAGVLPRLRDEQAFRAIHLMSAGAADWPDPSPAGDKTHDLIVIDDLDALDGSGSDEGRRLERLTALAQRAGPSLHLLVLWRGTGSSGRPSLSATPWQRLVLDPLTPAGLRDAVESPARSAGHLVENGLVERLLEGVGFARNAVAQLQRLLALLWERRRRGWLDNASLDALGGVHGDFQRHLAKTMQAMRYEEALAAADLLRALVAVEAENEPWRCRAMAWADLVTMPALHAVDALRVRESLARAGLVDLWAAEDGGAMLMPVRADPRAYFNDATVTADEPFLRWRHRAGLLAAEWRSQRRADALLLTGEALAEAGRWLDERGDALLAAEREFIRCSQDAGLVRLGVGVAAGGEAVRVTAVPGQDVVVLHLADGPSLVLHPESARDLFLAQRERGGRDYNWPGRMGLQSLDVIAGVADAVDALQDAMNRLDHAWPPGLRPLGVAAAVDPGTAPVQPCRLPAGPLLVLVPGLMLDAQETFGGLWREHPALAQSLCAQFEGRAFAWAAPSLSEDAVDGALRLVHACPEGARLVMLTHGHGGLLAEAMVRASLPSGEAASRLPAGLAARVDKLASTMAGRKVAVQRVVRVAGPARGTLFASRRLDAYLSVFRFAFEAAGSRPSPALTDFLGAVARNRLDPVSVPGLAACLPDSPLMEWLNDADEVAPSTLFVVAGDLQSAKGQWIKTLVSDAFYWTDNDLIVQTRSMYGGVPRAQGARFLLDRGEAVQHFRYFANAHTAHAIVGALTGDPDGFSMIGPLAWSGQDATGVR